MNYDSIDAVIADLAKTKTAVAFVLKHCNEQICGTVRYFTENPRNLICIDGPDNLFTSYINRNDVLAIHVFDKQEHK